MYNKSFELGLDDIDIIEYSLKREVDRLTDIRLNKADDVIDSKILEIHDLLGKLHNQKVWYRPTSRVYVGG